ncbi:PsiF family protein [Pollutimonas bauzanensis]|nr:PsiF family protein [Pollutimonas bauzanensis]
MPAHSAQTAAAPAKAKTAQQERMVTCNQDAKGKTGDERKAFMSSCLKGETSASGNALSASQQRMKNCNADATAKALKGDQRKAFMSTCLKAK